MAMATSSNKSRKSRKPRGKDMVRVELTEFGTDPHSYKPFAPRFRPADTFIFEVPIPAAHRIEQLEEGGAVYNLKGLQELLGEVSKMMAFIRTTEM